MHVNGLMRGQEQRLPPGQLSNWEGSAYQFLNIMGHACQGKGLVVPEVPTRELR
jgi:hypothetical protein